MKTNYDYEIENIEYSNKTEDLLELFRSNEF